MSEATWWLILSRGGRCGGCREAVPAGVPCAYRHADKAVRCRVCIDNEAIEATPSRAYREATHVDERGATVTVLPDDPAIRRAREHPYKRVMSKAERKDRAIGRNLGAPPPQQVKAMSESKRTKRALKRKTKRKKPAAAESVAALDKNIAATRAQAEKRGRRSRR